MKKVFVYAIAGALLVSSCGSYTASGAYTGSMLGSILGSAIGGLSDGPRGSDWGSILGMAGGAVVGAAVGSAADRAQEERIERKRAEVRSRIAEKEQARTYGNTRGSNYGYDSDYNMNSGTPKYGTNNPADSGYDPTNSGDDRIEFSAGGNNGADDFTFGPEAATSSVAPLGQGGQGLEIRNVRFFDENRDQQLQSNETMRLVFEVRNMSPHTLYDVRPHVEEVSGAKVYISPDARVESLAPGKGIRYTAMVKADRRLKAGTAVFRVQAVQANGRATSNVEEVSVPMQR